MASICNQMCEGESNKRGGLGSGIPMTTGLPFPLATPITPNLCVYTDQTSYQTEFTTDLATVVTPNVIAPNAGLGRTFSYDTDDFKQSLALSPVIGQSGNCLAQKLQGLGLIVSADPEYSSPTSLARYVPAFALSDISPWDEVVVEVDFEQYVPAAAELFMSINQLWIDTDVPANAAQFQAGTVLNPNADYSAVTTIKGTLAFATSVDRAFTFKELSVGEPKTKMFARISKPQNLINSLSGPNDSQSRFIAITVIQIGVRAGLVNYHPGNFGVGVLSVLANRFLRRQYPNQFTL